MKDIKPEMHDIGKLIESRVIKHNFENYPESDTLPKIIKNSIWEGILEHHYKEEDKSYPQSFETFVLAIADAIASKSTRFTFSTSTKSVYNVYKLWNPPAKLAEDLSSALGEKTDSAEWISKIVNFINSNPGRNDYIQDFGQYLKIRPEDVKRGNNISSLYTHCILTSMFYQFFYPKIGRMNDDYFKQANKKRIVDKINEIKNGFRIKTIKIVIHFFQDIIRVRDLNIFDKLIDIKQKIKEEYPYSVLFSGFNTMILITTADDDLSSINRLFSNGEFWYDVDIIEQTINNFNPDPDKIARMKRLLNIKKLEEIKRRLTSVPADHKEEARVNITKNVNAGFQKEREKIDTVVKNLLRQYKYNYYPDLDDTIHPPICELCQIRHATEIWSDKESGIEEKLCSPCCVIRGTKSRFTKLNAWQLERMDRILWIKINLNYGSLIDNLEQLYESYLNKIGIEKTNGDITPKYPLVYEFLTDYDNFLCDYQNKLNGIFHPEYCQMIMDELYVISIKSLKDILKCLESFAYLMTKIFPVLTKSHSPISISIVCSNPKYSFMDAWRKLQYNEDEVYVSILNKGKIKLRVGDIAPFLSIRPGGKTMIHKLTAISEKSEELAKILINDKKDKYSFHYRSIRDAIHAFGFQNVLTYVKILGD